MNALQSMGAKAAMSVASVGSSAAAAVGVGDPAQAPEPESAGFSVAGFAVPALSRETRLIGFGVCFGVGFILNLTSFGRIFRDPVQFAILMGVGQILILLSSGFFLTFRKQLTYMFDSSRRVSTGIYLAALVMVFVFGLAIPNSADPSGNARVVLCILSALVLYCAGIWYGASYFPFAQAMIRNTVCYCCSRAGAAAGIVAS